MRLHVGLVLLLVPALLLSACGGEEGTTTPGVEPPPPDTGGAAPVPTKAVLIGVLRDMLAALEAGDHGKALSFLVAFPGMSEEDGLKAVGGFIEKREISGPGIDALEADGKFGFADEIFGARAIGWAERVDVPIEACYAISLEDAEVVAHWNGTAFKLLRLDDVGKVE